MSKFYLKHYAIALYDYKTDEEFYDIFDNVPQLARKLHLVENTVYGLLLAVRKGKRTSLTINGHFYRVHLIDMREDEDEVRQSTL